MLSAYLACRAKRVGLCAALASAPLSTTSAAAETLMLGADFAELTGEASSELTLYPQSPRFDGQRDHGLSFAIRPEATLEWDSLEWLGGASAVAKLTPFLRIDTLDDRRTHFDFREAKFELRFGSTDVTLGADYVYWGKAETDQIVDIINQTDGLEGSDGEDKLGQPMVAVRRLVEAGDFSGELSAFYLPYFRERTFLGAESRLRSGVPILEGGRFESDEEEWTPSFAARLSGFYGDFDGGISAFHGLSRDPAFAFDRTSGGLRAVYGRITQLGFDGQYTRDATLFKLETIFRAGQRDRNFDKQDYVAVIGGLEHTLYGVAETNMDLGLIAEYAFDARSDDALTPFENDLVLGARLAVNDPQDTALLVLGSVDTKTGELVLRAEGERRIGDSFKLSLEGLAFVNADDRSLFFDSRDDHSLRVTMSAFW